MIHRNHSFVAALGVILVLIAVAARAAMPTP
jgi:hypothetical protein